MSMIVLDVESSGTEYHVHSILSLGAIELENPTNQFYEECHIWDGAHIMEEALEVNGFTQEEASDPKKKTEAELVRGFLAWANGVGEKTLAGQNVSFDRVFLKAAAHPPLIKSLTSLPPYSSPPPPVHAYGEADHHPPDRSRQATFKAQP